MQNSLKAIIVLLFYCCFINSSVARDNIKIPILCYHNLNPTQPGSMSLTPVRFESQIKWLLANGFHIISLQEAVDYLEGRRDSLPKKPIVITADDGWKSIYTYMYPIVRKYHFPVTLFIFPQVISNGKNNLTWEELKELQKTGLFDIQSHTYSHPNFKVTKRHLSSSQFEKFVSKELTQSKMMLEEKLGKPISFLAWPFGIYNDYLEKEAAKAGYKMAFTIDYRPATKQFNAMAQPRFMIIEKESQKFKGITNNSAT